MTPFVQKRLDGAKGSSQSASKGILEGENQVFFVCTIAIGVCLILAYGMLPKSVLPTTMMACFFGALLLDIFTTKSNVQGVGNCLSGTFSLIYGVLPWCAMWELYDMGASSAYLLFLLVVVWGSDTGGYFGGKLLGRHKLMPRISPKKTVEGALVGLAFSVFGALAVSWSMQWLSGSMGLIICMAIVCGILAQMGDLLESTLKRVVGVKDSSHLLPGHGGFLDRVDGLLMAAPFMALWFRLLSANF